MKRLVTIVVLIAIYGVAGALGITLRGYRRKRRGSGPLLLIGTNVRAEYPALQLALQQQIPTFGDALEGKTVLVSLDEPSQLDQNWQLSAAIETEVVGKARANAANHRLRVPRRGRQKGGRQRPQQGLLREGQVGDHALRAQDHEPHAPNGKGHPHRL